MKTLRSLIPRETIQKVRDAILNGKPLVEPKRKLDPELPKGAVQDTGPRTITDQQDDHGSVRPNTQDPVDAAKGYHIPFGTELDKLNAELLRAVDKSDVDALWSAILKGAKVNTRYPNGDTALIRAARIGNAETIDKLIMVGADKCAFAPESNKTALMIAVELQHEAAVNMILHYSIHWPPEVNSIDIRGAKGVTAVMLAASKSSISILKSLLRNQALWPIRDDDGEDALMHAIRAKQPEHVKMILQHELPYDYFGLTNKSGKNTYDLALESGNKEIIDAVKEHVPRWQRLKKAVGGIFG